MTSPYSLLKNLRIKAIKMLIFLAYFRFLCTFIPMKEQVTDISKVLQDMTEEMRLLRETVNQQYAEIIKLNSYHRVRFRDWRRACSSVRCRITSMSVSNRRFFMQRLSSMLKRSGGKKRHTSLFPLSLTLPTATEKIACRKPFWRITIASRRRLDRSLQKN